MLTREEELTSLSAIQRYVWNVAQAHYDEIAGADYDRLPAAAARLEADRNRTALGDVLRILGEIMREAEARRNDE